MEPTIPAAPPRPADGAAEPTTVRRIAIRLLLSLAAVGFVAFWTWALFFASKEGVNRVEDRAWAERAQVICLSANEDRNDLADFRAVSDGGPEMVRERADIVDRATDIVERMLDDIVAVAPADEKGRAIVPLWEADYRIHLDDRRAYTAQLREAGENLPFYETEIGIPLSEKIETFAVENDMPDCRPPADL